MRYVLLLCLIFEETGAEKGKLAYLRLAGKCYKKKEEKLCPICEQG